MISAGMLQAKKANNPSAAWHRYLNYGLLGLATRLQQHGYAPRVFHGHFDDPQAFVRNLHAAGHLETSAPILLSLPSSYALAWARGACQSIKLLKPHSKIVVGGRWVTADDGQWIRKQIPGIDLVVYGTADHFIHRLLDASRWPTLAQTDLSIFPRIDADHSQDLSTLDYRLLDGFDAFTPSFEVSRGCGRRCGFCAEGSVPLAPMKSAAALADEIEACQDVYGDKHLRAYFEASFFRPTSQWISSLGKEFAARGITTRWRTETRVDNMSGSQVHGLAKAGLHVLDLGLESASPQQLRRMHKTTNPDAYLRRASDLLKACRDEGVWAKVNVLLYPGEDKHSLDQTAQWLDEHKDCIKGISAGPLILYRYGQATHDFLDEIQVLGARPVAPDGLDSQGFTDLHLSASMSHEQAVAAGSAISRAMMSDRDYYDLKAFNYFARHVTFTQFSASLGNRNQSDLPFSFSAVPAGAEGIPA